MDAFDYTPTQIGIAQFGSSMEVAAKLRDLLKIKSVQVIPAALTSWEGWSNGGPDIQPSFSTTLGRLAAPFLAYELANALVSHAVSKDTHTFRIGVASG